jgi:hypothetical protein
MLQTTRVNTQEMVRAAAVMLGVTLASCAGFRQPAVQTSASKPTVSYVYSDDQGLLEATRQAESYCAQYSAWPRSSDIVTQSDGRHVTFFCDQPRTVTSAPTTVVVPPAQQVVSYPYRDDRGLRGQPGATVLHGIQCQCAVCGSQQCGRQPDAHVRMCAHVTDIWASI